ncbi:hypothetical protein [Spirulina major]|nr:hypothetical protein [Spirulina major]
MAVQTWSERKQQIFKPQHLKKAWTRLKKQGWLVDCLASDGKYLED